MAGGLNNVHFPVLQFVGEFGDFILISKFIMKAPYSCLVGVLHVVVSVKY